jgi:hypothetical protein
LIGNRPQTATFHTAKRCMAYLNQNPNIMKNLKTAIFIFLLFIDYSLLNAQFLKQEQWFDPI